MVKLAIVNTWQILEKNNQGKEYYETRKFKYYVQFKSKEIDLKKFHKNNEMIELFDKNYHMSICDFYNKGGHDLLYSEFSIIFAFNMYVILISKINENLNHPFFSKNKCEEFISSVKNGNTGTFYTTNEHYSYHYLGSPYDKTNHKYDFVKNLMNILNVDDNYRHMMLKHNLESRPKYKQHRFFKIGLDVSKKFHNYISAIYNSVNKIHEDTYGEFELNFDLDIVDNQEIKSFKNSNKTQEEINTFIVEMMLNDNNFPIKYKTQIKLWQMEMPWSNLPRFSNTEIINKLYENSNDYNIVLFGKNIEFNVCAAYDKIYTEGDECAVKIKQPNGFDSKIVEMYPRNEKDWEITNKIKIFEINAVDVFTNMYSTFDGYGSFIKYLSSYIEKYNFDNVEEITKKYHEQFLTNLLQGEKFKSAYGIMKKEDRKAQENWENCAQAKRVQERSDKKTQSEKKSTNNTNNNSNNQKNESKQNSSQPKYKNKNHGDITNYLIILRLDKLTTKEDLSKHYKELVKYYHPDVNDSENAGEMLKLINNAYSVLQSMF